MKKENAVIASVAKQSLFFIDKNCDCHAPAGLAMTDGLYV